MIDWSLIKYEWVVGNVLVSKLYKIAHDFDIRAVIKKTLGKILGLAISLILFTDSES